MPTRSKAEKQRIEKRIRIEKTVVPIVSVVGIAVFIVICALLGKSGALVKTTGETPSPTTDPCAEAAAKLKTVLGGSVTTGDGFSSLSYKCAPDQTDATVNYYLKNGVLCMKMVRKLPSVLTDPTPAPTEDIFEDTSSLGTESPDDGSDKAVETVSGEIVSALQLVSEQGENPNTASGVFDALKLIIDGTASKASLIYGIYIVELKYSKADKILTVVCEPA